VNCYGRAHQLKDAQGGTTDFIWPGACSAKRHSVPACPLKLAAGAERAGIVTCACSVSSS
jgi:hypothetical protein